MNLFTDLSGDVTPLPTDGDLHIKTSIGSVLEILEARRAHASKGASVVTAVGAERRTLINTLLDEGSDTTTLVDAIEATDASKQKKEIATVMALRVSREREAADKPY